MAWREAHKIPTNDFTIAYAVYSPVSESHGTCPLTRTRILKFGALSVVINARAFVAVICECFHLFSFISEFHADCLLTFALDRLQAIEGRSRQR